MVAGLGADACPGGWVGVRLVEAGDGASPVDVDAFHAATIAELVEAATPPDGELAVVGIDIPVGLPDASVRAADVEVRRLLGPRRSSVFMTPTRAALGEPTHALASATNVMRTGLGISQQAYHLRTKIFDVDGWVRGDDRPRVVEVHPELSFRLMAGAPLEAAKKTWAGQVWRRDLLTAADVELPRDLGGLGRAAPDDVLDAAAAAWSALRVARGEAVSHPDEPERFSDGWPAAIWG
ncbi:DUF429 domain-containing protein [Oerskovia flava]|uniref:DUF429 domain-containing protein n=1 Tax=Oerskovia flava TaxID=2986422 RepID=UPI00223F1D54|nr:DUF429 domain-containing protein [Oerskovia sp. JB1-3-2]